MPTRTFRIRWLFPIAALLSVQVTASANMGTTLMWAGIFHLIVGNAIIGIIEGLIAARVTGAPKGRACALLVGANYVSMVAGFALSRRLHVWLREEILDGNPLQAGLPGLLIAVAIFMVASLFIEWPLFLLAAPKGPQRFRKSWKSAGLANLVTSIGMLLFYFVVGPTSMLWRLRHDPTLSFVPNNTGARVYYLAVDGSLRSIEPTGANDAPVSGLPPADSSWFIYPHRNGPNLWTLHLGAPSAQGPVASLGPMPGSAPVFRSFWREEAGEFSHRFLRFADIRQAADRAWNFDVGVWAAEGLLAVRESPTPRRLGLALDTPFVAGSVRDLTVIDGGLIVFVLEPDQIIVADLDHGNIGVLVRGISAVTVRQAAEAPTQSGH